MSYTFKSFFLNWYFRSQSYLYICLLSYWWIPGKYLLPSAFLGCDESSIRPGQPVIHSFTSHRWRAIVLTPATPIIGHNQTVVEGYFKQKYYFSMLIIVIIGQQSVKADVKKRVRLVYFICYFCNAIEYSWMGSAYFLPIQREVLNISKIYNQFNNDTFLYLSHFWSDVKVTTLRLYFPEHISVFSLNLILVHIWLTVVNGVQFGTYIRNFGRFYLFVILMTLFFKVFQMAFCAAI